VTVHICTVTIPFVKLCTTLHNFTSTNVGVFLAKMCKMKEFLYYIHQLTWML